MEFGSSEKTQDKSNTLRTNDVLTPGHNIGELNMEVAVTADEVMLAGGFGATDDLNSIRPVGTDIEDHIREARAYKDVQEIDKVNTFGEVNMEASITSDEVMRAGGFGATDGISNFLPVASDFTDFEANLRGAREYEDLVKKIIIQASDGRANRIKLNEFGGYKYRLTFVSSGISCSLRLCCGFE